MRRFLYIFLVAMQMTSCKKFLSEEPTKQASIQTVDQLMALLNNPAPYETDYTATYSTDDCAIPLDLYNKNPASFSVNNLYFYTFDNNGVAGLATDALWTTLYNNIFRSNLILPNLGKVSGSDSLKNITAADAYFVRAYSFWVLANHYCTPYQPGINDNDLGLPLKVSTDYSEPLARATLKETYDQITSDINEAKKTPIVDVQDKLRWRVSQKAISAFLSRYYLFLGDYDSTIQYANDALQSSTVQLVDYHGTTAGNPAIYSNPADTLKYGVYNDWTPALFYYWKEFYFLRFTYTTNQWFMASPDLINLYDKNNDFRYKWFFLEHGNRRFNITNTTAYRYSVFYDGRYIPSGPTIAEILLNKAEALARQGNVSQALSAVNTLRTVRLNTNAPLVASTKEDALKLILQERRRELPFAMRWYDIRRYSVNDDPSDDVTINRPFYKISQGSVDTGSVLSYSLPLNSLHYAVPINTVEINSSRGQIQQNSY